MNKLIGAALLSAGLIGASTIAGAAPKPAKAPKTVTQPGVLTLFEEANYNGGRYEFTKARTSVSMNWNIKSVGIAPGETWEVCQKPRYQEPCMTLDKSYANSNEVGLEGMIKSARPLKNAKPGTTPAPKTTAK